MTAIIADVIACRLPWLASLLPFVARSDREQRAVLGMAARHPERPTAMRGREAARLGGLRTELWPESEWTEIVEEELRWRG